MPQDDRQARAAAKRARAKRASQAARLVGSKTVLARFVQKRARAEAAEANRESREILKQMPKKRR